MKIRASFASLGISASVLKNRFLHVLTSTLISLSVGFPLSAYADDMADLIAQVNKQSAYQISPATQIPQTADVSSAQAPAQTYNAFYQSYAQMSNIKPEHIDIVYQAEQVAKPAAQAVLQQARRMTLDEQKIIRGSCWDYLNAVFGQAMVNRDKVFVGSYPSGPFINTYEIEAGDWLYFVNHSYYDGEHSGLFVGWVDEAKKQALILSYAGESRREPARYKVYDISHTYNVMRPVEI